MSCRCGGRRGRGRGRQPAWMAPCRCVDAACRPGALRDACHAAGMPPGLWCVNACTTMSTCRGGRCCRRAAIRLSSAAGPPPGQRHLAAFSLLTSAPSWLCPLPLRSAGQDPGQRVHCGGHVCAAGGGHGDAGERGAGGVRIHGRLPGDHKGLLAQLADKQGCSAGMEGSWCCRRTSTWCTPEACIADARAVCDSLFILSPLMFIFSMSEIIRLPTHLPAHRPLAELRTWWAGTTRTRATAAG